MKVILVEDHRLVADAFTAMLREVDNSITITACYSTQHALTAFDSGERFNLVLTDLLMPGIDGIGLLTGLRNRNIDVPVVIISGSAEERYVRAAAEQGAAGFIPKTLPGAEMINGIRQVLAGHRFFPENYLNLPTPVRDAGTGLDALSSQPGEKQLQVLQLMADGHSNKQISQIVGIKEATVKYHTSQLFKLFGVKNRTSCVREAQERGLIRRFEQPSGLSPT